MKRAGWTGFWDEGYENADASTMGGPSHEVIVAADAARMIRAGPCKVLDIGCGEGRNSLYLAGRGHSVTAVDPSGAALKKLQLWSSRIGHPVRTQLSHIQDWNVEDRYEIVLAHGCLHYLSRQELADVFGRLKKATVAGGLHLFTLHLFDTDDDVLPEMKEAGHRNPLRPGELRGFYDDWHVIAWENYDKWDCHPGIGSHVHPVEKWVLQAPGAPRIPIVARPLNTSHAGYDSNKLARLFGQTLINAPFAPIESELPSPDRNLVYKTTGWQFSADGITQGHELTLSIYGKFVFYVVAGKVVGKAIYERDFQELVVDAASNR